MIKNALLLAAVAALAACSSGSPTRTVTITRTRTPPVPASSTPATSAPPTSSAAPSPTAQTRFDGTCDTLLPHVDVQHALHGRALPGTDAFVVGPPERSIGRLAYLNCRYGVTGRGAAAVPKIEIGISLYATAGRAAARITATVDDYGTHGATATDTTVGDTPATVLTGGTGAGYDVPLLVLAAGQRTVAVSVDRAVATGARASADAVTLAALALDRTAP